MTSRGDPEKIYRAQRTGVLMRLVQTERIDEVDAKHWLAQWEREAEGIGRARGSVGYWEDAWHWIEAQRSATKVDTRDMDAEGDDGQVYGG